MKTITTKTQFLHTLKATPKDDKGKVRPIQKDTIDWKSSNDAVVTVEEDPADETQAKVTTVGAGTAQVTNSADADLGDGVVTITGVTEFIVEDRRATNLETEEVGEPVDLEA